ncbi:MAG: flagellar type III secretion system protein FliR [Deltaproteobacteria bacterium]|nr:flagellar type III secretion system protein FliR [Deltaproteobacteria bacterium]MBW2673287.1 flagellar type III secretion system protein FliR [Deltaproteobacteria bacterium]
MNIPDITAEQIEIFILVLLRVSAIVVTIPIFGSASAPVRVKAGLSLAIAFLLVPFVEMDAPPPEVLPLAVRMVGEVMIGVIIGFAGRLVFAGVQLAGQLAGFQMGFAIVNVFDPITSSQVSIIAQFQYLFAVLVFLAVDGHHIFLSAIAESYRIVSPLDFHFSAQLAQEIAELAKSVFVIAIKAAAPAITALLMIDIGFGLIARTVPQLNILIVGFPVKIAVGLIGIGLALPLVARMMSRIFLGFGSNLHDLLRLM